MSAPDPATYGSHANPDLLARIPLDAGAVLDVGCGAGALGAAFRRLNPHARLEAVEPDPVLAAAAQPHYDAVHRLDIEAEAPPIPPESLDALVYGDVLEHLRDPWGVLRRDAALLAPDGVALVCIPNVEHWSFAARLIAGNWAYEEMGLFDRTHLRWFTREGMRAALEFAGLVPIECTPRVFNRPAVEAFCQRIAPALAALGVDAQDYARRAAPLQYVWRATRRRPVPLAIAARTLRPVGGVNEVRVIEPLRALCTRPGVTATAGQQAELPALPGDAPRVILLQRRLLDTDQAPLYIRALRATGAVVVQEFDDDPAHWPSIPASDHFAFRGVHAVQTSTPALAAHLRQFNPEVAVFPNAIADLPEPANFRDPARMTLFFGAMNREADVAPFLPALNAVLAEAGEALAVEVVHDRAAFDALATPRKRFTPTAPYGEYRRLLGGCEIAFLPLRDTRFNRFKSDLKWVESGAHRLCVLASPVVYAATVRDGETGLIVETPDAFAAALRGLIADPARARRIAEAARAEVRAGRMLAQQVAPRLAWYRDLWERRAALDAALVARAPRVG